MATRVFEIELNQGLRDYTGLDGYEEALVVVRYQGRPLDTIRVPCAQGVLRKSALRTAIEANEHLNWRITHEALSHRLLPPEKLLTTSLPTWSVVICTRNRTDDLRRCLDSLLKLDISGGEIIVIDNAPSDDSTARLAASYPVRYLLEPRKGLNWARSLGAKVASNDIVIYTDDDVLVADGWIEAMCKPFINPQVAAVTGLVLPLELETEAQELFEQYGGFGRGFYQRDFTATTISPVAAGSVGAGASMAIRRQLINQLELFAVEFDAGTATLSGGDTYAFYRLLSLGYQIMYNPDALVWHRHRRTLAELRHMLYGYSVGTYAFFLRCLLQHGDVQALYAAWWWFRYHHLRQLWLGIRQQPHAFPLNLTLAEIRGCLAAPQAYWASIRRERAALYTATATVGMPDAASGGNI